VGDEDLVVVVEHAIRPKIRPYVPLALVRTPRTRLDLDLDLTDRQDGVELAQTGPSRKRGVLHGTKTVDARARRQYIHWKDDISL
jgi:hypothetical protein